MAEKTFVTVSFERIQRVVDILSMVSIGEYNPELIQIEPSSQADEFSVLEAALNIYNQELASARLQNERYISELEQSKRELQEQIATIAKQQMAIHELSTPIVEVWEDILLLPIISSLDAQRATEMTEKLLDRVKANRARCIIIDITGVELVDTNTANSMLKMTRAARLLGAMCVLTGVRPEIARTMVQLGVELDGIKTLRTLKDGLRECFGFLHQLKLQEQAAARSEKTGALSLLQTRRHKDKAQPKQEEPILDEEIDPESED
ncbi:MAG: STAS domain-containing protein [Polyangia bacterium]|jgi:rsbT co-antagonist protein RsbR